MAEVPVSCVRLFRLAETARAPVCFTVDGIERTALDGDTVLTAVLASGGVLRTSEFGDGHRAGFCLMGACQDCWMWTQDGARLRACGTMVTQGLALRTTLPDRWEELA